MATSTKTKISHSTAYLRIVFGVIWAIDAVLKWQPAFLNGFLTYVKTAAQGQPSWLNWWFNFWLRLLAHNPQLFAVLTAIIESLIAIALILGLARRFTYITGALFSLFIWGIGEGFGGPYMKGSTDIGTSIIYAVVFLALYLLNQSAPAIWSLDNYFKKKD